MDIQKIFPYFKIPLLIFLGVLIYIFIISNQVLKDKASVFVEQTTTYTTQMKRERPDLYLKNIEAKAIKAVENSENQLFMIRSGHDLIANQFKSDVAKLEMIKIKLDKLRDQVMFLKNSAKQAETNKALSLRSEIASLESKIKLLLLDQVALRKSVNKYEQEIDMSFSRIDTAGKVNAKLRSFLKSVQGAIESAKIYNENSLGSINTSGYSDISNLMSEVKVISEFMQENADSIIVDDLFVDEFEDIDAMFDSFMTSSSDKDITP